LHDDVSGGVAQLSDLACFAFGDFAAGRAQEEKALALYDPAQRPAYSELVGPIYSS
jgi:hypothetical protein